MSKKKLQFSLLDEEQLNDLVIGDISIPSEPWSTDAIPKRIPKGKSAAIWRENSEPSPHAKPVLLAIHNEDMPRLFARFSQLRSELSPLSSWCHIISTDQFSKVHGTELEAELFGLDASWAGLIVAEARILANRPLSALKIASCLATQSFAIARTTSLWGAQSVDQVLGTYGPLQSGLRQAPSNMAALRPCLEPIWNILLNISGGKVSLNGDEQDIVSAIRGIQDARLSATDPSPGLANLFGSVADVGFLEELERLTPEDRLKEFDSLIEALANSKEGSGESTRLSFLAGYLATIAAGGASSIQLAEGLVDRYPQVTAWAYTIGGVGEAVTWTAGFSGLGRLVARELQRSFYVDQPPIVDFAALEAAVLIDRQLTDPLVNLRIKQARSVTVSLYPGVNVVMPIHEQATGHSSSAVTPAAMRGQQDDPAIESLARAVYPYISKQLDAQISAALRTRSSGKGRKKASQKKLL